MASFNLFAASTTPQTLLDGEAGFIGQLGGLSSTGTAITATGRVSVTVLGALQGTSNAIGHSGTALSLYLGQLGALGSTGSDSVRSDFTERAFVSNDGALFSGSDALDLRASDEGGSINILNTGSISGVSDGIVTSSGDEGARIVNLGTISGGDGGIDHLTGDALLVNRGEIVGGDINGDGYGYSGGSDVETVRNFGSILGGVFGEAGDDLVRNAGVIDDVDLGDGNDQYEGRGGSVEGRVEGGGGDDVLRGGGDEDLLAGGADADILRGRDGDDTLRGDGGGDVLNGGRGDDVMRGGGAADIFRFAAGDGFDVILDLAAADVIDLEALGLRSFRADLRDAIRETTGGALVDLSEDYGLSILLRDVEAGDLRGNDFLL